MERFVYKVKKGDNLEKIADAFGVSTKNITPQKFDRGDRVVINLKNTIVYVVMPGDDVSTISKKLNIVEGELLSKNVLPLFVGKHIYLQK